MGEVSVDNKSDEKSRSERPVDPLIVDREGHAAFILGNEAIVRGALEAGVAFACGYPGTPSSEITDTFARLAPQLGITFEYSINEKIALEMAFAASLAGARSIVAMKHLGLMYAGDPLATIPYIGTVGGMVIVSAGDPSCMTSPNEQDQRPVASMLHIPVLDPGTAQEALELTRFAFELSERSHLPVILRPTTRVCHTRAEVTFGQMRKREVRGFTRDPSHLVPIPAHARKLRAEVDERLEIARDELRRSGFLRRSGNAKTMIVAAGVPAAVCADILREQDCDDSVSLLRLGAPFPLPESWLVEELQRVDRVLVVEELLPFVEDTVLRLCAQNALRVDVFGKRTGHLPTRYEYTPELIGAAMHDALGIDYAPATPTEHVPTPVRAPTLCAACPHRGAFFAARAAFGNDVLFFNDIGCYTLGFGEPLDSADALLSMGAGFTLAAGVSRTTGQKTVGFMGDSTFFHSGMPALLNAIKEGVDMVAVIMDNEVTAMTGFQESPSAEIEKGRIQRRVDLAGVVRALGAERVEVVDPNDLAVTVAAFRKARETEGLSVIITERPCPVFTQRIGDAAVMEEPCQSVEAKAATTYTIDHDLCQHCGRQACGHRCGQSATHAFEQAMARARSLENGVPVAPVEVAPCASACPLFLCVQGYAAHIASGDYAAALELIMAGLPLPSSVCRVCHRPCEVACVRADQDEPVAINDLKRFVVDWADAQEEFPYAPTLEPEHGRHVAVVGAGPCGLAAAHELRLRGYAVTVYDSDAEPGGLLLTGVPRYRLPLDVLRRDVARIRATGVEFVGERRLGGDLHLDELVEQHDAVLLAIGTSRSRSLELDGPDGSEGPELVDALAYLRSSRGSGAATGRHVVVIGGGNSAIDSARTALRSGAERVVIACLESRAELPAIRSEIAEAAQEGIEIRTRVCAVRRTADGIELVGVEPRVEGRFDPDNFQPVAGTENVVPADQVIVAIGQTVDRAAFGNGNTLDWHDGRLAVDSTTLATPRRGVFASGDLAPGDGTVTGAIATGLRAAWGIDRAMRGNDAADRRPPPPPARASAGSVRPGVERIDRAGRQRPPELDEAARRSSFDEVTGTLDEASARAEAARCMICGACGNCRSCIDLFGCPAFFVDGNKPQISEDLCVACGVCAQFCPNGAIKPVEVEA